MRDLIIIGSGPAGLTAAIYAARANLHPLVLAGGQAGGQLMLTSEVENYPGFVDGVEGPALMAAMRAQAERFGAEIVDVDATRVDFSTQPLRVFVDDSEQQTKAVVIATGAEPLRLNCPGEQRLRGRGVSTCATCDGAFFRNKDVLVVGGGDSALEEALFLARLTKSVTIVHRRDAFRASRIMRDRVGDNAKISVRWNCVIEEIHGERTVSSASLQDRGTGHISQIACDGIFVAIGHRPNTDLFAGQVELGTHGYVDSRDGVRTSVRGVFVAGDVYDAVYRQAVTAAGMGCKAAIEAERFLELGE